MPKTTKENSEKNKTLALIMGLALIWPPVAVLTGHIARSRRWGDGDGRSRNHDNAAPETRPPTAAPKPLRPQAGWRAWS